MTDTILVPPAVTVRDAAHLVCSRQVRELRRQERLVLKDHSVDAVHDMRVATRRLRAAMAVFGGVVDLPKAGGRRRLRWVARRLGRVRDLDVRAALLRERFLPHVEGVEAARVVAMLRDMRHTRARAYRRLAKGLRRPRYRRLRETLGDWVREPAFLGEGEVAAARWMAEAADRAAQRVSLHEAMRGSKPSAESLHDLRIAVKWLRYTLDFHGESCGLAYDVERALARDLQDCLGEMRDHDLLLARLAKEGEGGWPQVSAAIVAARRRLWRRFLEVRRRWHARTRQPKPEAPAEEPRFVNLEVTPVQLRLVSG